MAPASNVIQVVISHAVLWPRHQTIDDHMAWQYGYCQILETSDPWGWRLQTCRLQSAGVYNNTNTDTISGFALNIGPFRSFMSNFSSSLIKHWFGQSHLLLICHDCHKLYQCWKGLWSCRHSHLQWAFICLAQKFTTLPGKFKCDCIPVGGR
jgi:hypothetical protein